MSPFRRLLFTSIAFLIGCSEPGVEQPQQPATEPDPDPVTTSGTAKAPAAVAAFRTLADGLTADERKQFNHLSLGSELIPLEWLRVLRDPKTGKPFLDEVERYGLIPDPENPDGLPIGLTAAPSPDFKGVGPVVGFNCAACHTGQIRIQEQTVVITGGQSLFDVVRFNQDLFGAMTATAKEPDQLVEFVIRLWESRGVLSQKQQELARHMRALVAHLHAAKGGVADRIRMRVKQLIADAVAAESAPLAGGSGDAQNGEFGDLVHGYDEAKDAVLEKMEWLKLPLKRLSEVHGKEAVHEFSRDLYITVRLLSGRKTMLRQLVAIKKQSLPQTEGGPGRVDDFSAGRNLLFPADQAVGMTSPCSVPPLWGLHGIKWTDWDGNTTSALGRSMLTALAGGAAFDPKTFISTVPPQNLLRLEQLSERLTAPKWPEDLLGKLDRDRIGRGKKLFEQHCARCHQAGHPSAPEEGIVALEEVGTDPQRLRNFSIPVSGEPVAPGLQKVSQKYLDKASEMGQFDREAFDEMERERPNQWRQTNGYVARSLAGIFATAPYLHNGSVPTLRDLLSPPAERTKVFSVGNPEYDPIDVGYRTDARGAFKFDTAQTGNSNTGHVYGTELPENAKQDLLEYLKSL